MTGISRNLTESLQVAATWVNPSNSDKMIQKYPSPLSPASQKSWLSLEGWDSAWGSSASYRTWLETLSSESNSICKSELLRVSASQARVRLEGFKSLQSAARQWQAQTRTAKPKFHGWHCLADSIQLAAAAAAAAAGVQPRQGNPIPKLIWMSTQAKSEV